MKAAYLKGIIDYIELRHPGVEFALQIDGDNLALNLMTHVINVANPSVVICIIKPSPVDVFTVQGFSAAPLPKPRDMTLPKDFQ